MKVVIIAGGKGTRIAAINHEIPKGMIPIGGKPIIEREIEMARDQGYREFVLIIGHQGDQISSYLGDGSRLGVSITYYQEQQPLGTAGALGYLRDQLTEDFFVFYGDTVMDIDMASMLEFHRAHQSAATLLVHPNDHPFDSDIIDLDSDRRVRNFLIKPHPAGMVYHNIVNASLFIFSPRVLDYCEAGVKSHIEKNLLPRCLEAGLPLYGYISHEYIKDMGTVDRYHAVSSDVERGVVAKRNRHNKQRAVFLDRDGTINVQVDFLYDPAQVELIEGVAEAIQCINRSGYLAIVVTNQPVIARNLCSLETLDAIHARLETLLGEQGAYLNAIYFCPHHPDKGYPEERPEYKIDCECRKPKPGMLLQAARDWNIDLSQSIMIGDSWRDEQAAQNAGVRPILIPTNAPHALLNALQQVGLTVAEGPHAENFARRPAQTSAD